MPTITGTTDPDNLSGGSGNDTIFGLGDDDNIFGGAGNDVIRGDAGAPTAGKAGKVGKAGDDLISAGSGNDIVFGDGGDDIIDGGLGADTLYGDWTAAGTGTEAKQFSGDDTFVINGVGEGYGDVIYGGTVEIGGKGKAGKGTDNDTLNLTGSSGPGIKISTTTSADSDGNGFDGVVTWTDNDGNVLGTLSFENIENLIIPCFTSGTMIQTSEGEKPVEDLCVGDQVLTLDSGYQPIRWIGGRELSPSQIALKPNLRPIKISAGALGMGMPTEDLEVSRQHRVLVRSEVCEQIFDDKEVLVPANKLVGLPGVEVVEDGENVTYWHFLFNKHEIVWANGSPTESLFTGREALKSIPEESREELFSLFPELALPDYKPTAARLIPEKGKDVKRLIRIHKRKGIPLLVAAE